MSIITLEKMNEILTFGSPDGKQVMFAEEIGDGTCTLRMKVGKGMLRPGGTLSGPAMMTLADAAMWACIITKVDNAYHAVTTNLNINFLHKPPMKDVLAKGSTLKLGKRLAIQEVTIYTEGEEDKPIAHATATYSIPPK